MMFDNGFSVKTISIHMKGTDVIDLQTNGKYLSINTSKSKETLIMGIDLAKELRDFLNYALQDA